MDSKLKSVFLELVGKHKDILGLSDETVDAIMKDCAGSEDVNPEMDKPEMDKPEMDEPEMDKPEMDKPEMDKPEMDKPEMDKPEMDKPEMDKPEMDKPEDEGTENEDGSVTIVIKKEELGDINPKDGNAMHAIINSLHKKRGLAMR